MNGNRTTTVSGQARAGRGTVQPGTTPGSTRSRATSSCCGTGVVGCSCPACAGLATFVRPRFFAGQLLTDAELTALTTYVVDKQKLHNRYLHGSGVVCGLQVECDGCGPGVIVRPGYALDPCGSDIVLPDAVSVDIAALVRACSTAPAALDCDPPRHPVVTGCDEVEQVWCLWVSYAEQEARPVAPVGGTVAESCGCSGSASSAGCGCGGSGKSAGSGTSARSGGSGGCGCGGGGTSTGSGGCGCGGSTSSNSRSTGCGCRAPTRTANRAAGCEPSRIHEYLRFGVAPLSEDCGSLTATLDGTFPARVAECIGRLQPLLTTRVSNRMQRSALSVLAGGQVGMASGDARDALCQLYANVLDLYRHDPMRTMCVLPEELATIDCSPRGPNETEDQFRQRLAYGLQQLLLLVVVYLRDCVCGALLPPCPPGVCDDRVVLACVTIRDGVVVEICNHACRRYAGSFVNREYWLPIGPVLSLLAAKVCCLPLSRRRGGVRPVQADAAAGRQPAQPAAPVTEPGHPDGLPKPPSHPALGEPVAESLAGVDDPRRKGRSLRRYDHLLSAIRSEDFALARLWRARTADLLSGLKVGRLLGGWEATLERSRDSVRLASFLHTPVDDAVGGLQAKGVEPVLVEVDERSEALAFDAVPRSQPGSTATLFVRNGIVVGVAGTESLPVVRPRAAGEAGVAGAPR